MSRSERVKSTKTIEMEIWIDASPEVVFAHFIEGEKYKKWMNTDADINPVPGGDFRFDSVSGRRARGTYLEIVPSARISFSWGWEGSEVVPPGSTRVDVRFVSEDGGTRVLLSHSGIGQPDLTERHRQGWVHYLDCLEQLITTGEITKGDLAI